MLWKDKFKAALELPGVKQDIKNWRAICYSFNHSKEWHKNYRLVWRESLEIQKNGETRWIFKDFAIFNVSWRTMGHFMKAFN